MTDTDLIARLRSGREGWLANNLSAEAADRLEALTTPPADEALDALDKQASIISDMIHMGERISFGADTAVIDQQRDTITALRSQNAAKDARIAELERLDREAATHVESVIAMRTGFTGDEPYVGWRGLGMALNDALDDRDQLRADNERLQKALKPFGDSVYSDNGDVTIDQSNITRSHWLIARAALQRKAGE